MKIEERRVYQVEFWDGEPVMGGPVQQVSFYLKTAQPAEALDIIVEYAKTLPKKTPNILKSFSGPGWGKHFVEF